MAEFSKVVITSQGQALIAKMIAGAGDVEFTKIRSSSAGYAIAQLAGLTELSNIEQTSPVSKVARTNEVAVKVEASFVNTELTMGYFMRTLGLYAVDPDEGEILYAVTVEVTGNCYIPPYNGVTVSGIYVQLVTTVGNAENVSLEVDPSAVATIGDIHNLQGQIDDIIDFLNTIGSGEYIEAAFLEVFTKTQTGDGYDPTAMTLQEVEEAIATEWNGKASDDPAAMTPAEIDEAIATEWNGETSDDPTALSSAEVAEAIGG